MSILNKKYNKFSPIGFYDSGIGGLTVLNKVKKLLPNESFLYYGDTLNMPYGEKTKEELIGFSDKIFKFFEQKGCKAVVMACNTTSSVVYEDVKDKYNLKLYPIVQSVSKILSQMPITKLGIFATKVTISSGAYQKEISKYNPKMQVFGQFCPKWVHIVEENSMDKPDNVKIVKSDLEKMLKNNPEKIVLGCTHYPFLLEVLSKFVNSDIFIDPAINFAKYIKEDLKKEDLLNDGVCKSFEKFYVSSNPQNFKNSSKMFYEIKELPELLLL
jgi:glutamate racemase